MRPGPLAVLAAALLCVTPLTSPAHAQAPGSHSTAEAARHFDRGVKLYGEEDWRAALIEFRRAYDVAPNYHVLFNIAQCLYQLQDYAGAYDVFERYLGEGGAEIAEDRRRQVLATVEDLRGRIAHVRIHAGQPGVDITVDDVEVGRTPLREAIAVSEGRRKIVASIPGAAPVVRFIDVAGEDTVDVDFDSPRAGRILAPAPADAPQRPGRGSGLLVSAIVSFGVAAAGAAVGTSYGLSAMAQKRDLDSTCAAGKICAPSGEATLDRARRDALVSTIGWVGAAVGAAAGIGLVIAYEKGGAAPNRLEIVLAPGCMALRGHF